MLQNARVTAFTISELLKENQQWGLPLQPPPPPPPPPLHPLLRLGLNWLKRLQAKISSWKSEIFHM